MFCPGCGLQTSVNVRFCRSCGIRLDHIAQVMTDSRLPRSIPLLGPPEKPPGIIAQVKKQIPGLSIMLVGILFAFLNIPPAAYVVTGIGVLCMIITAAKEYVAQQEQDFSPNNVRQDYEVSDARPQMENSKDNQAVFSVTEDTTELLNVSDVRGDTNDLEHRENDARI